MGEHPLAQFAEGTLRQEATGSGRECQQGGCEKGLEADASRKIRCLGPAWLPGQGKSGHWEERLSLV